MSRFLGTLVEPDILDVLDFGDTGTGDAHVECCIREAFICGAPYHPEAAATEDMSVEDCCETCQDVHYESKCPPKRPTHQHCPLSKRDLICPR
jgi:hypothetical protein